MWFCVAISLWLSRCRSSSFSRFSMYFSGFARYFASFSSQSVMNFKIDLFFWILFLQSRGLLFKWRVFTPTIDYNMWYVQAIVADADLMINGWRTFQTGKVLKLYWKENGTVGVVLIWNHTGPCDLYVLMIWSNIYIVEFAVNSKQSRYNLRLDLCMIVELLVGLRYVFYRKCFLDVQSMICHDNFIRWPTGEGSLVFWFLFFEFLILFVT